MMIEMRERASCVVGQHFYDKYGYADSVAIISKRLDGMCEGHDADFWADVLSHLDHLSGESKQTKQDVTASHHL